MKSLKRCGLFIAALFTICIIYFVFFEPNVNLDPRFLPDLFEPFTQADKSLGRVNGGLGLGLSIAKGITELHGGSVSAYSEGLGKGSNFTIRLPLSKSV